MSNNMAKNSFICPACQERTIHVELHMDEVSAMMGQNFLLQLNARFATYIGMTSPAKFLTGIRFYKCTTCGLGTSRKPNGKIHECFKDGKRWSI